MVTHYDYWLWHNVLPKEFCEYQLAMLDWSKASFGEVNTPEGCVVDPKKRISDLLWLDNTTPIGCVAQVYANMANDKAGWNFNLSKCEAIQIGKYSGDKLGFYGWHPDDGAFSTKGRDIVRKLSVAILLSDTKDFTGGNFEFEGYEIQPELKQGSVLVFPSIISHRVTPVTSGIRYSAVTWISGPPYR